MRYFAYGSNLNSGHLQSWIRRFGVQADAVTDPRPATLRDYLLRTNYLSGTHDAGACNIEPSEEAVVEGVLMSITQDVLEALKAKEGHPHRCFDRQVAVHVDGARTAVRAVTFVVSRDRRLDYDLPVSRAYRDLILVGADEAGLSAKYQKQLRHILIFGSSNQLRHILIFDSSKLIFGNHREKQLMFQTRE